MAFSWPTHTHQHAPGAQTSLANPSAGYPSAIIGAARRSLATQPAAVARAARERQRKTQAVQHDNSRVVLFTHPASRGKIVEWYVQEKNLANRVEFREMDMKAGEHKSSGFLRVNPFGRLPAMSVLDEDTGNELYSLHESGALLLTLAEMAGETDTPEKRAVASQWALFANSTLGNALFVEAFRDKQMPAVMRTLDAMLAERDYLSGEGPRGSFTVGDVAVGAYLLYVPLFFPHVTFEEYPNVCKYMANLSSRQAYQSTLGARIDGAAGASAPPASHMPAGGDKQAAVMSASAAQSA